MPPLPPRRVFLRDLALDAAIGWHAHEHGRRQRIRVNVDLAVTDDPHTEGHEDLARVLDYEALANTVRAIVAAGHVRLAETLAERIATACLADTRVESATIRVEKLDVFPDAAAAGIEITRHRA